MDEIITRSTDEYKALDDTMSKAITDACRLVSEYRPAIEGERYLSTEEVSLKFNLSRRALQKYRDNLIIPHTSIAGKILYPLSEIERILTANYRGLPYR